MKTNLRFTLATGLLFLSFFNLSGCAGRNKAEVVDTKLEKSSNVVEDVILGVRKGEFTVQEKKLLSEEMRKLQNDVLALEDRVYGNREYQTFGVWGKLHLCRSNSPDNKKSEYDAGELIRPSDDDYVLNWKLDRKKKAVIDKDSGSVLAINEKSLVDSVIKYSTLKKDLQKKEDEVNTKLIKCKAEQKK